MRLLNTKTRTLEEFEGDNIPLYAILSHTWGKSEITLQDIEGGNAEEKPEYGKVRNTCDIAAADGLDYVWIDTCCIDKKSSAELSEAINSMYSWYQDSAICYAYLADVPPTVIDHPAGTIGPKLLKSRWFTRGWTLQELIAPSIVIILNQEWEEIGTKISLKQAISKMTRIPGKILLGGSLKDASVAQRMSWASTRQTTRIEDLAYCLMGIFGINMPLLYGEGERAFTRLQEEIIKVSDDHSIFAWRSEFEQHGGLLATSPDAFRHSGQILQHNPSETLSGAITLNNKGIHLKLNLRTSSRNPRLAILPCTKDGKQVAIYLTALSATGDYFARVKCDEIKLLDIEDYSRVKYGERSICVQIRRQIYTNYPVLLRAAEGGCKKVVELLLDGGAKLETRDKITGNTPLSLAARCGHETVVKLLLERGAELEARCNNDQTPLSYATGNGHELVVKLLLERGAKLEAQDCIYQTPLSLAAKNGHETVVKLLLEKGAELEARDYDDQTPLSLAAMKGHEAVVNLLLEKGAELEVKDKSGETALSLATANEHEAVVNLLLEKGAHSPNNLYA